MKQLMLTCIVVLGFNAALQAQLALPYYQDFETDTTGWYSDTSSGDAFEWDSVNFSGCSGTMGLGSGINSAGTSTVLYSPWFDFSNAIDPVLCITHAFNTTQNQDGVRIEYTHDELVWDILGTTTQGINWYTSPALTTSNLPAWSGISAGCINSAISLSMLSGFYIIKFRFIPTMNDTTGEYFLDDFRICESPCACTTIAGTVELPAKGITVYPNPATTSFTIDSPSAGNSSYFIYNATSQLVASGKVNSILTVPTGHLSPGIYLLKIITNTTCVNEKLIIQTH
ncbi:MAG TPA: T9SS type A sorting domain-containing protein [Bacteroidia bacterium]|nr:T9SS type A sorting domain-containing protein [Bacteroidia bacterium]